MHIFKSYSPQLQRVGSGLFSHDASVKIHNYTSNNVIGHGVVCSVQQPAIQTPLISPTFYSYSPILDYTTKQVVHRNGLIGLVVPGGSRHSPFSYSLVGNQFSANRRSLDQLQKAVVGPTIGVVS